MNPFETLGAEARFDLDLGALEKRHRELSRALHPDKFAQTGASERRAALEKAAQVNEAWRIVRDPIRRAEALFRIAGVEVGETKEPKPDPMFLMEMLELREAVAEARAKKDRAKIEELAAAIGARKESAEKKLAAGLGAGDAPKVVGLLGELRFYKRFLEATEDDEEEVA
ncbi:MAG TPA: Fe-S protein assembly co-chaperone HscB [Labilithrix sp.]